MTAIQFFGYHPTCMKTNLLRRFAIGIISLVGLVLLQRFCHRQTDGFSRYKISSNLPFHSEWETEAPDPHLLEILDQPFSYLAKGAQSYVFSSADDRYVIKFFRIYHLTPPAWLVHLKWPLFFQSYRLKKILQKQEELEKDFASYKIAYDHMKEETGILYLHLNKTDFLHKQLTFYDKIGIKHVVNLDEMEFLIQKKAELVYPSLSDMVKTYGIAKAKTALENLVVLLCTRASKGIKDKDPDLNTNFGFIDDHPLQIDVGRFRIEETNTQEVDRDEIIRITDNLNQWLRAEHPELATHLDSVISQIPKPL